MAELSTSVNQLTELSAVLAAVRHRRSSTDGLATAIVTGQGSLVELELSDAALRGPHADRIGLAVVEAVAAARKAAEAESLPQLRAAADPGQKQVPQPSAAQPEPVRDPVPTRHRPRPDEVEESYDQIDFIDGDITDNDTGGGRW